MYNFSKQKFDRNDIIESIITFYDISLREKQLCIKIDKEYLEISPKTLSTELFNKILIDYYKHCFKTVAINTVQQGGYCYLFKNVNAKDYSNIPVFDIKYDYKKINNKNEKEINNQIVDNILTNNIVNHLFIKGYCNWTTSTQLANNWNKLLDKNLPISFKQDNKQGIIDDLSIVINGTHENVNIERTIYFPMEPNMEQNFGNNFKRFENCLFFGNHKYHLNNVEWHLSKSVDELKIQSIQKEYNNVLSVIITDKNTDPGHILRLLFIRYMDDLSKENKLPFELHIYGTCKKLNFHNYKGELPPHKKEIGLFKYKYHFNAENHIINNYVTEKFYDSNLSECFTFYWGSNKTIKNICRNLGINEDDMPYLKLDLIDNEKDVKTIYNYMKNKAYENNLNNIRKLKKFLLHNCSLSNRIQRIFHTMETPVYIICKDQNKVKNELGETLKQTGFKIINFASFDYTVRNIYHLYKLLESHIHRHIKNISDVNELEQIPDMIIIYDYVKEEIITNIFNNYSLFYRSINAKEKKSEILYTNEIFYQTDNCIIDEDDEKLKEFDLFKNVLYLSSSAVNILYNNIREIIENTQRKEGKILDVMNGIDIKFIF